MTGAAKTGAETIEADDRTVIPGPDRANAAGAGVIGYAPLASLVATVVYSAPALWRDTSHWFRTGRWASHSLWDALSGTLPARPALSWYVPDRILQVTLDLPDWLVVPVLAGLAVVLLAVIAFVGAEIFAMQSERWHKFRTERLPGISRRRLVAIGINAIGVVLLAGFVAIVADPGERWLLAGQIALAAVVLSAFVWMAGLKVLNAYRQRHSVEFRENAIIAVSCFLVLLVVPALATYFLPSDGVRIVVIILAAGNICWLAALAIRHVRRTAVAPAAKRDIAGDPPAA